MGSFTHQDLVEIGEKWLRKPFKNTAWYGHSACSIVLTEYHAMLDVNQIPDVIGWNNQKCIMIECKTSIADLKKDFNKKHHKSSKKLGTQRWYLVPEDIQLEAFQHTVNRSDFGMLFVGSREEIVMTKFPTPNLDNYDRTCEVQILVSLLRKNGIKQ